MIWCGEDYGLVRIDPATGVAIDNSMIPALREIDHPIYAVALDAAGKMWTGSRAGLTLYDRRAGATRRIFSLEDTRGVAIDSAGMVWFGGIDGVHSYDPITATFTHSPFGRQGEDEVVGSTILGLVVDRAGQVWIGTDGGISKVVRTAGRFERGGTPRHDYGAVDRYNVRAMCQDTSGRLWIGTAGSGVVCLDSGSGKIVRTIAAPGIRNANFVNTIFRDHSGRLWLGTRSGIFTCDGERIRRAEIRWPATDEHYLNVWCIREDTHGTLWVATTAGRFAVDMTTWVVKLYRHRPEDTTSICYNGAWTVLEDHTGEIWIGTPGGLERYDRATDGFIHYRYNPSNSATLSNNEVWVLFEDRYGGIWVGTWGGGLNKLDQRRGGFVHYMEENGLASNTIHGIEEDAAGNLWISTGDGVSKLDPRTGLFTNFGVADGLAANEYNPNACLRTRGGEILFGGIYGVSHFEPSAVGPLSSFVPPVVITSFRKLDSLVATEMFDGAEIEVGHDENYCSFEFAALDFEDPGKIRYAYMLEGLDRDWIYSGGRRYVAYTNLEPGSYTFRVKATNSDGVWNDKGIAIHLHVIPPFWSTWAFRTFAVAMLGLGLLAWYIRRARRTRQLELALDEAREIERRGIAAELHDGPLQDLYSLRFILEPITADDETGAAFEKIDETLRKVRGSLRNVCGDLQLPSFECGLDIAIAAHAERLCESFPDLDIRLELAPEDSLSHDVRRNMFRAYRSAINNVLKHADASRIDVRLRHDGRSAVLEVEDNGRGFPPPQNLTELMRKKHYGLLLIDAHARSIGGKLEIESSPGAGTLIRVTAEVQKSRGRKSYVLPFMRRASRA
jgi:signal transduction histidine kinase/streptogramin lyase